MSSSVSASGSASASEGASPVGALDPSFKGKWFAAAFWPIGLTRFDEVDELAKLRALDEQHAGLVKNSQVPNMVP